MSSAKHVIPIKKMTFVVCELWSVSGAKTDRGFKDSTPSPHKILAKIDKINCLTFNGL